MGYSRANSMRDDGGGGCLTALFLLGASQMINGNTPGPGCFVYLMLFSIITVILGVTKLIVGKTDDGLLYLIVGSPAIILFAATWIWAGIKEKREKKELTETQEPPGFNYEDYMFDDVFTDEEDDDDDDDEDDDEDEQG